MNSRRSPRSCRWLLAVAGPLLASMPAVVCAQAIPPAVKTAADATPSRKVIDDFVKAQVKKLTSKTDQPGAGRDALERECSAAAGASSSYLTVYAEVVNANLLPVAADKDVKNRLNAAIANARVAAKDPSPALSEVTTKFINDPVEAVSLWGMKAARFIVPASLQAGTAASATQPLLASISGAVKRFPQSGAIADEAYHALRVDTGVNVPNPVVQAVIPEMLNVMRARVAVYQHGLPGLLSADNQGVSFFALKGWGLLTPAQQKDVMQMLSDLVSEQGQHIATMSASTRNELLEATKVSGGAFQVIGGTLKDAKITEAGKSLQGIGVTTPGDEIKDRTDAIYPALITNARFKDLKEPPKVDTSGDAAQEQADDAAKPDATAGK